MAGAHYTSCVKPEDYEDYSGFWVGVGANLWEATDYMLHRKLVCLGNAYPGSVNGKPQLLRSSVGGTSFAVGRVMSFEPPSSKSFPDNIDNDFSFNILLRPDDAVAGLTDNPFTSSGWKAKTDAERLSAVRSGYEGVFLTEQETPRPHEAGDGDPRYGGYTSQLFFDGAKNMSGAASAVLQSWIVWFVDGTVGTYPMSDPGAYSVPVLHCECEGSRINDVYNVVNQMPGGGSGCKKHWYTAIACFILRTIFLPFTLGFVAEAWAKARDGNYHDAMAGNGDLNTGDLVLVAGRWVFDAGHKGHNEIHAVDTIQKIPEPANVPPPGSTPTVVDTFYKTWRDLAGEVPPDHAPGQRPQAMTPAQTAVYDNQQKPENRYTVHPLLDGCAPAGHLAVERIEPSSIERPGDYQLTIWGQGFMPGATALIDGGGVQVTSTTVQSAQRIVVSASLDNSAATGARSVTVQNPNGEKAMCDRCLTVTGGPIIH